jgi:SsrA-binding protein
MDKTINIKNKRASFEYFLIQEFSAGIMLTGTEIKSIRYGKANITDAYCSFKGEELFVHNMHIAEYTYGTHYNHEPKRDRKLLLTKRELRKLLVKVKERGFTIIPVLLFINENGLAKLNIALAKGKHSFDKRDSLREKDMQREMESRRRTKYD